MKRLDKTNSGMMMRRVLTNRPLKRRKPLPGFSEKPAGALREGEEEEKESVGML